METSIAESEISSELEFSKGISIVSVGRITRTIGSGSGPKDSNSIDGLEQAESKSTMMNPSWMKNNFIII